MSPKGWHLESSCRVAGVLWIHIPPVVLLTVSVGQGLGSDGGRNWDHCLKRLSVEVEEIVLEEAEWRSSTAAKLGREGERKNGAVMVHRVQRAQDEQPTQFTASFPAPSSTGRYTDTPVSALLVWASLWVSTWWSFCFKENLGKSSRKAVLKENSSSCQVESSQSFV